MADAEDKKQNQKDTKGQEKEKKSALSRLLPWLIMIIVIGLCAGAGLGLGKILAGNNNDNDTQNNSNTSSQDIPGSDLDLTSETDKYWFYDLEPPVVANLNEPGITRYASGSFTFQMSSANEKEIREYLDEKAPILRNWLYIYLSSLKLENVQGDKNLKSIQIKICDSFNEELFPESKPQIKQILIREFAVQ